MDINKRYRSCAIYCVVQCLNDLGRGHVLWSDLEKKFGLNWESLTNELRVKGILCGSSGFMYLSPLWRSMSRSECMSAILKIYPYPYHLD